MNWAGAIAIVGSVILALVKAWIERTSECKKALATAKQTTLEGIESHDTSKITAGFDAMHNSKRL